MSDAHLTHDEMVAWRDSGAGDRARIIAHLATCAACRQTAADVERSRPADDLTTRFDAAEFAARGYRAGAPAAAQQWRPRWTWVAAAAAALILVAVVPVWLTQREAVSDALRGSEAVVLVAPANGATVSLDALAFEWTIASPADRVRLNVVDVERPAEPIIEREVTGSRYMPTDEERGRFELSRRYHWYVEMRGGAAGTSLAASFVVR